MRLPSRSAARLLVLGVPLLVIAGFILGPLLITLAISVFEKQGFWISPAFTLESYRLFFTGVRLEVLERSFRVACASTALMLLIAYPIAYLVTLRVRPELTRAFLFLFAVPFLVNYIVRTFAWADILSRTGFVNSLLLRIGLIEQPLDWLLFSDFAVYLGLVTAYMPFMIFPIWLSLSGIDRRLLEASWVLGAPPLATFWRVTLPLSLPGVFAAAIFGFVGVVRRGRGLADPRRHRLPAARQRHRERAGRAQLSAGGRNLHGRDRPDAGAADRLVPTVRRAPVPGPDHGAGLMPEAPASSRAAAALIWACLGLVLLFLYGPLVPPAIHSFARAAAGTTGLFDNYAAIFDDARLMRALRTSLVVGVLVALIAPLLALLAAEAVRVWRMPRLIIALMLLPLFVPGISMGLATGLFFQILGFKPSLLTITAVHVLWALPFAFLIILTVMANFDQVYLRGRLHVRRRAPARLSRGGAAPDPPRHPRRRGLLADHLVQRDDPHLDRPGRAQHGADLPLVPVPAGRPEPAPVRADDPDHRHHARPDRPGRADRLAPAPHRHSCRRAEQPSRLP